MFGNRESACHVNERKGRRLGQSMPSTNDAGSVVSMSYPVVLLCAGSGMHPVERFKD